MNKPNDKKVELAVCPFCGGSPVLYGANITDSFGVYCSNDECGVQIYDMYRKKGEHYSTMRSKKGAIKAWNTRKGASNVRSE